MAQHYSNPKRANDPYALPDIEVYFLETCGARGGPDVECHEERMEDCEHAGWYWQSCMPGCLPDGDPSGPFATEQLALEDARDSVADDTD